MKLTHAQQLCLEELQMSKVASAGQFYRHAFEALVKKGLAVKHTIGRGVTYSISEKGGK